MSMTYLLKQLHFPGREASRIAPDPALQDGRDCAPPRCRAQSSVVLKAVGGVA